MRRNVNFRRFMSLLPGIVHHLGMLIIAIVASESLSRIFMNIGISSYDEILGKALYSLQLLSPPLASTLNNTLNACPPLLLAPIVNTVLQVRNLHGLCLDNLSPLTQNLTCSVVLVVLLMITTLRALKRKLFSLVFYVALIHSIMIMGLSLSSSLGGNIESSPSVIPASSPSTESGFAKDANEAW
jgi:hypothetical protein